MIIKLIKRNRKTSDLVFLQTEGTLIRKKEGKLGRPMSFSSTLNCGTDEKLDAEFRMQVDEYISRGYIECDSDVVDFEVFDKAKWHINNSFPKELNLFQSYVPTGFYVGWLVIRDLISDEVKSENKLAIDDFVNKKMTSVEFYKSQLDGVFCTNDVCYNGYQFTKFYFDFEKGKYLIDFENLFAKHLPTLFHVVDSLGNFEKICRLLDTKYAEWKIEFQN